jgi:hypothetical protein
MTAGIFHVLIDPVADLLKFDVRISSPHQVSQTYVFVSRVEVSEDVCRDEHSASLMTGAAPYDCEAFFPDTIRSENR